MYIHALRSITYVGVGGRLSCSGIGCPFSLVPTKSGIPEKIGVLRI